MILICDYEGSLYTGAPRPRRNCYRARKSQEHRGACGSRLGDIATATAKEGELLLLLKKYDAATAKFSKILWGALDQTRGALRAAPFVVCRRSLEQVSKML